MGLGRLFARAEIPAGVEDQLRELGREGRVVFVMRSSGWLNLSFIRWLVHRLGWPALGAAIGIGGLFSLLIGGRGRLAALRAALGQSRAPALIFLRRPRVFHAKGVTGADHGQEPFRALCALQRAGGPPIYLVPILYVWSRRPQRLKPSLIDIVLGSTEAPGSLATSIAFLRNYQRAFVRMGRPIDLRDFLAAEARRAGGEGDGDAAGALQRTARKVRGSLYYHLSREARAIVGPPFKSPRRVREEVLRDPALQQAIAVEAERRRRPPADVGRQAARMVKEIAARMSPLFFELIRPLVVWICTRLYQGIELDEDGLAEVRLAANRGALVLCPSHKSHMDYVILTLLFYEKGLLPPHVAAGINLAFWPFGAIARWCGGFFIRRSFKGDHLYSAVLRAYVKRLIRDGFPQEFFIEGGRSRTGKLASPRTGLLAMEVDAWSEESGQDLSFVPIAIDYEKLPEGKSYARELGGGDKPKESFWSLLEARKTLRSRHGRIYVRFDRPISMAALVNGPQLAPPGGDGGDGGGGGDKARRAFIQSLANRIAYGINRASTLTPVGLCAAALLGGEGEVSAADLVRRLDLLRRIAVHGGGHLAGPLVDAPLDPDQPGPIGDALAALARDGLCEARGAGPGLAPGALPGGGGYLVPRQRRPELDFFRNNVIHHFVAFAIIAAAQGATPPVASGRAGDNAAAAPTLESDTRWLSRLFKLEFRYRVGARFETIFAETVQAMAALGLAGDSPQAPPSALARDRLFLAQMVRPYADAYRVAADTLNSWTGGDRRAFNKSALQHAIDQVAAGRALPESASKTTLENAAAWLAAEGAFTPADAGPGDRQTVTPEWRDGRAAELVRRIDRYRP
ncbi:MAG TPA: 1-acyl-sn-glycerol-3-phosphate acyltransferase [Polyangia bacterium]|jgi:glycerol-3-phosphate O-acyltransferase|nr:1-acyl-sn-glycerol-3-phosphate acyltransferase [Polyangia bacterium]